MEEETTEHDSERSRATVSLVDSTPMRGTRPIHRHYTRPDDFAEAMAVFWRANNPDARISNAQMDSWALSQAEYDEEFAHLDNDNDVEVEEEIPIPEPPMTVEEIPAAISYGARVAANDAANRIVIDTANFLHDANDFVNDSEDTYDHDYIDKRKPLPKVVPQVETFNVPWIEYPERNDKIVEVKWKILIAAIAPILEGLFPGNWDIREAHTGEDTVVKNVMITVKFPHVTIARESLSKGVMAKHNIEDLYVRMTINNSFEMLGNISGTRGTLKDYELAAFFAHSHLTSQGCNTFDSFCQGNTTMREILSRLQLRGFFKATPEIKKDSINEEVSEDSLLEFEAFLHQLGAFVSHEATNGTPYKYISRIQTGISSNVREDQMRESFVNFMRLDLSSLPFKVNSGRVEIVYDDVTEELLNKAAVVRQRMDSNGTLYSVGTARLVNGQMSNLNFVPFIFRGEMVQQKIIKTDEQQEETKTYCHVAIREYILQRINQRIISGQLERSVREVYERKRDHVNKSIDRTRAEAGNQRISELENLVPIIANPLN